MRLIHLAAIGLLGTAGYTYVKKEFWPPTAKVSPQKIKNRHEMIRFYERAIADIEDAMGRSTRVNVRSVDPESGISEKPVLSRSRSDADGTRRKQIEEYQRRIAAMKAEIGEQ